MEFGQIFVGPYPPEAAMWCNQNGLSIAEIEPDDKGNRRYKIVDMTSLTEQQIREHEITELKAKLSASDYAIIKIAEGAASQEEYAELIAQRQEWRARINELEAANG